MSTVGQSQLACLALCTAAVLAASYSLYSAKSRPRSCGAQSRQSAANKGTAQTGNTGGCELTSLAVVRGLLEPLTPQLRNNEEPQQQQQQHVAQSTDAGLWWAHDPQGVGARMGSAGQRWERRFIEMLPGATAAVATVSCCGSTPLDHVTVTTDVVCEDSYCPHCTPPRNSATPMMQQSAHVSIRLQEAPDQLPTAEQQVWLSRPCPSRQLQAGHQLLSMQHHLQLVEQPGLLSTIHVGHIEQLSQNETCIEDLADLQDQGLLASSTAVCGQLRKGQSRASSDGDSVGCRAYSLSAEPGYQEGHASRPPCAAPEQPQPLPLPYSNCRPTMTQQGWERAQGLSAEHQASSPGPATSAETDSQAVQAVQELAPCSSLACEQQLGEMPCNLLKAEQLSDALQQQCRILAAETRQLQQRENTAKLWTAQLQVRHDEQLKKLMQAQQQLEQLRSQYTLSQQISALKLQHLLSQLQAEGTEGGGQVVEVMASLQSKEAQAQVLFSVTSPLAAAGSASAVSLGQQVVDETFTQLEAQLMQMLKNKEVASAPLKSLELQVNQLTVELHSVAQATVAASTEKQLLVKAKAELLRKLSDAQRQLAGKSADLATVTNDRMAMAAAKNQLHHHVQALQKQQLVLEAAVQKAQQTADANAQKAGQLQEALTAAQAIAEAAQVTEQQVVQLQQQLTEAHGQVAALQVDQTHRQQQVAELQLQLERAHRAADEQLQLAAHLQSRLQEAAAQSWLIQQQFQDAAAARNKGLQQISRLQQQAQEAAERASGLQQQVTHLQAAEKCNTHEALRLQERPQQAQDETIRAQQQFEQLEQELQATTHQMQQFKGELSLAQQQAGKNQEERAVTQNQISSLQTEAVLLKQQAISWQHDHDAAYEDKAAMQRDRDAALDKVKALQQDVDILKQQHAAAEACVIELHLKLEESSSRCQQSQKQLASMQEEAELESSKLVEALGAAQARIAGSTQQVVEAQQDVTQLAQVVELQQQQLAWQQDHIGRLKKFIAFSPLQLQIPDEISVISTSTSPAGSPGRLSPQGPSAGSSSLRTPRAEQQQQQQILKCARGSGCRSSSPSAVPRSSMAASPGSSSRPGRHGTAWSRQDLPADQRQGASCQSPGSGKVPSIPVEEGTQQSAIVRSLESRVPSRIPTLSSSSGNSTVTGSSGKQAAVAAAAWGNPNRNCPDVSAASAGNKSHRSRKCAVVFHDRSGGNRLPQESLAQGISRPPQLQSATSPRSTAVSQRAGPAPDHTAGLRIGYETFTGKAITSSKEGSLAPRELWSPQSEVGSAEGASTDGWQLKASRAERAGK